MEQDDYTARSTIRKRLIPTLFAHFPDACIASLITPRLYLSNYTVATSEFELSALGITHIISVFDFPPDPCPAQIKKRLHIHLSDTPSADLLRHFEETTEFIRLALAENETNKVLVGAALV
jgi:atypical dual specificity phosphatase